jgi:acyl-CoA synthetase (AMP-forming)/AMP-acid ligase II/acyl carrier protein
VTRDGTVGNNGTILDSLERWAAESGARRAFTFLGTGEADQANSITFGELHKRTRSLASHVSERCGPGSRVLLLYPPGLEYITGLLATMYASCIPVPAYPPQRRSSARVLAIMADCEPSLALTESSAFERVTQALTQIREKSVSCLASDLLPMGEAAMPGASYTTDEIALLQYTSGSTGNPKGVRVTHAGLLASQGLIQAAFGSGPDSRIAGWLPPYHDMGLVGMLLHPLYLGVECVFMAPAHFLQRPARWLEAISKFGATISGGPDSAFRLCTERVPQEEKSHLNLARWKVAFNGSERVRSDTMTRFAEAFAPSAFKAEAFFPCYGLAEATLLVTGGRSREMEAMAAGWTDSLDNNCSLGKECETVVVNCGRAALDTEVIVVDPQRLEPVPDGILGEIWVRGPGVSPGYWTQAVGTESWFDGRLAGQPALRYLRTGDLGFLHDGELFPAGRLKDLIVVAGVNYFPEDLEHIAEASHVAIGGQGAVAFACERDSQERVVLVVEVKRHLRDPDAVLKAIRGSLGAELGVPLDSLILVPAGSLPRTSSGKKQRSETRLLYLEGCLAVIAEWRAGNEACAAADTQLRDMPPDYDALALGEWIARHLTEALGGVEVSPADFVDEFGLDSLAAANFVHRLQTQLDRVVPLDLFCRHKTVLQVSESILASEPSSSVPMEEGLGEPTPGQLALWLTHQIAPEVDPYHIATSIRLTGNVDFNEVKSAVQRLVARHEALRTIFPGAHEPRLLHPTEVTLREVTATGWSADRLEAEMTSALDEAMCCQTGPLVRFVLYSLRPHDHVLLIAAHHIVCDGWSMEILHREFAQFYAGTVVGSSMIEAATPFSAYQRWLSGRLRQVDVQEQLEYWARRLRGSRPLPIARGGNGRTAAHVPVSVGRERALSIAQCARRLGVSPFVFYATAMSVALHTVTGETDIIFGTDSVNRPQAWMRGIVGMIANQLVLRSEVLPNATFAGLAANMKTTVTEALHHQEAPFARVVSAVNPPREAGRNPLFQIMFTYRNRALPVQSVNGTAMWPSEVTSSRPKFDITLALTNEGHCVSGFWEFNRATVDGRWAENLVGCFERALDRAVHSLADITQSCVSQ